jgi:hypothetical protein
VSFTSENITRRKYQVSFLLDQLTFLVSLKSWHVYKCYVASDFYIAMLHDACCLVDVNCKFINLDRNSVTTASAETELQIRS